MGRNKKTRILSTSSAVPDEDIDMDDCPNPPLSLDPGLSITTPDGLEAHITVGATVELNDGSFIRVRRIDQSKTRCVETFSGELFGRMSELPGLLFAVHGQNELVLICEASQGSALTEGSWLREANRKDVKRIRQVIVIESREMDSHLLSQYHAHRDRSDSEHCAGENLFCRWTLVAEVNKTRLCEKKRDILSFQDGSKSLPKALLLYSNSGIYQKQTTGIKDHNCIEDGPRRSKRLQSRGKKQYKFADAFCGAGGASRGAHEAGFQVHWAFDKDLEATEAYRANFPEATTYKMEASAFIAENTLEGLLNVDVLHISPPCQPFSPAHTTPGTNDKANIACLYAVAGLVKRVGPRVLTMENVPRLMMGKNQKHFAALVVSLTNSGYNMRWAVLKCVEYGLPQNRDRLFLIAAR